MKKATTREQKQFWRKTNDARQSVQALSFKHSKLRTDSGSGKVPKPRIPNFLANLEKMGFSESEGSEFLKKFANDAVL
jgi:hypothetical protein